MSSVKLYVYDLSNGMAKQLSMQLTGRQIDGIWHSSVVAFGKEIFYGQGILMTQPGRSHHGQPLQIIDMGETALDEETFNEYLAEMRSHYTADKYHLLDFNCNSFTDDCIGFLTGKSIPSFVKDLPSDFLSTPFGAALRPTIDAMFRRPVPGATPPATAPSANANASLDPQVTASILQAVAAQAQGHGSSPASSASTAIQSSSSITAPVHMITNSATFNNFIRTNRAAVALFTAPQTCPPCRMIDPVFERLAEEKGQGLGKKGAGFAKIDMDVGISRSLSAEWGIRATPTFIFFLDGKKIDELKGANPNELRSQVDLLLFQAFPPHPHTSLSLPSIEALSLNPILFTQIPAFDTVLSKQLEFLDAHEDWPASGQGKDEIKRILSGDVLDYLKARYRPAEANAKDKAKLPSANPNVLAAWAQTTCQLANTLPIECLFPITDMWRLASLDPAIGTSPAYANVLEVILPKAILALSSTSTGPSAKGTRNFLLIILRLLCNSLSHPTLASKLINVSESGLRGHLTSVLIPSLLHSDVAVRTASASLAFNVAAVVQKIRVAAIRSGRTDATEEEEQAEWETELVTAVVEALDRERESEEVVHRLTASLAFFLRLAPHYESHAIPLLEVLQSREVLKSKLVGPNATGKGWHAEGGLKKKEVRKLLEEVADKLCI